MRFPLAILAALAAAAPADAATVAYEVTETPGGSGIPTRVEHVLTVIAAPGEANRITFELDQFGFAVVDAGVKPQAGPGCSPPTGDGDTVGCEVTIRNDPGSVESVAATVQLGDGDDTFEISQLVGAKPLVLGVDGGPGADRMAGADRGASQVDLLGGSGRDELVGGALRETLKGQGGADTVSGGGGSDSLLGDGRDVMDGGDGNDRLDGAASDTTCGDGLDRVDPFSSRALTRFPYDCEVIDLFGSVRFRFARGGPLVLDSGDPTFDAAVELRRGTATGRLLARRRWRVEYREPRRLRVPRAGGDVVVLVRRRGSATLGFARPPG